MPDKPMKTSATLTREDYQAVQNAVLKEQLVASENIWRLQEAQMVRLQMVYRMTSKYGLDPGGDYTMNDADCSLTLKLKT